jgi:hypothetical protein
MTDWQPIETAPLDGRDVLLAIPGFRRPLIGRWWDEQTIEQGKVTREYKQWNCGMLMGVTKPEPTHWLPLPELPC